MKNRFLELDCLRGIAALLVVFFHVLGSTGIFGIGVTGVDLFFIISGFVIFLSINSVTTGKEFAINRISRLYPTYWVCVTITFILICYSGFHSHQHIHLKTYVANMTMFQYYLGVPDLDGPYWTMIIEMIFYILILMLFTFNLLKHIMSIGLGINFILLINSLLRLNSLPFIGTYYLPLLNFFPLFFAGIVFYKIYHQQQSHINKYLLLLSCYATQIMLYKFTRASWRLSQMEYAVMLTLYFSLFVLFANGWLKFIVYKPILFLGKISFSLYLIYQFFLQSIVIPYLKRTFNLTQMGAVLIAVPLTILLATLINKYFELPLGKRMKKTLTNTFNRKTLTQSV
jgi:peptidoglycan/LPS O-acetylase OafA/YrhL